MSTQPETGKSPLTFLALVLVLAIPFYLIDMVDHAQIARGIPLFGFAVVCPTIAAAILQYRDGGRQAVRQLVRRWWDFRRVPEKSWYIPTLLLYPAVVAASFVILRATGHHIPNPRVSAVQVLFLCLCFFAGAMGEELGWSGYATEPLQSRWNALRAGLIIGSASALWHWIPLAQVHRSAAWIAWWSLYTVAARVIAVWLFNNTGRSVFITVLFHTTLNLAWQLFPINGSHFNQPLVAILMATLASAVVATYGPTTLSQPHTPLRSSRGG